MKNHIRALIRASLELAAEQGSLSASDLPPIVIEEPKIEKHGDFSSNVAMVMASTQKSPSTEKHVV